MKVLLHPILLLAFCWVISASLRIKRQGHLSELRRYACKRRPELRFCKELLADSKSETKASKAPRSRKPKKTRPTTEATTTTTTTMATTRKPKPRTEKTKRPNLDGYCQQSLSGYRKYCTDISSHSPDLRETLENYCESYRGHCDPANMVTTKKPTTQKPKTTKRKDPDAEFRKCCQKDESLVDTCKYLCKFNNLNKQALVDAFFRNTCPGYAPRLVVNCASFGVDHTACCKRKNVHKIHGGQCMPFCNPTFRGHIGMGIEAAPCLDLFPQIIQCFKDGMPDDLD